MIRISLYLATTIIILVFTSCNSSKSEERKTPEQLRIDLQQQEQQNPFEYLKVNATMSPNRVLIREAGFFRDEEYGVDGYNIEGTIQNTASLARFKDVVLTVTFLSKTETILEQTDHIFYEFYEPMSNNPFSIHLYPPNATNQFTVTVKNAGGVE